MAKDELVMLRLSVGERRLLERAASLEGARLATWVRANALMNAVELTEHALAASSSAPSREEIAALRRMWEDAFPSLLTGSGGRPPEVALHDVLTDRLRALEAHGN